MCIAMLSETKLPQTAQGHLNSLSEVAASAASLQFASIALMSAWGEHGNLGAFSLGRSHPYMRAGCGAWEVQKVDMTVTHPSSRCMHVLRAIINNLRFTNTRYTSNSCSRGCMAEDAGSARMTSTSLLIHIPRMTCQIFKGSQATVKHRNYQHFSANS